MPSQPQHSSDSDDESNMRHDRFRSERFQDNSNSHLNARDEKHKHDRYKSRSHRGESSPKTYKHWERLTSSLPHRERSRSNHDRKEFSKSHYYKSVEKEKSVYSKKYSEVSDCRKDDSTQTKKLKLSALLKNFDKELESKRKISENLCQIGPSLPHNLKQKVENEKESPLSPIISMEGPIGPSLPPQCRNIQEHKKEDFSQICTETAERDNNARVLVPAHIEDELKNDIRDENIDGPVLPAHLLEDQHAIKEDKSPTNSIKSDITNPLEIDLFGPSLPSNPVPGVYGPTLPPKIEIDSYGPALPPNFKKINIQGPVLPTGMTTEQLEEIAQQESDNEDMVGPLPEGKMNMAQYQLDLRALNIKRKLEEEKDGPMTDIKKREEWMLELPPEKATNLGLGPRTFRMREAPDMSNRSSWTDTPADKLRKEEQALRGESEPVCGEEMVKAAFIRERDEAMEKAAQLSRDEDRPKSLLEMHQKKIKKKKKDDKQEGKKKERRPFDRDIDLQVNRFDEAQKKAIFKKAQLLNTRFSTGESKYL